MTGFPLSDMWDHIAPIHCRLLADIVEKLRSGEVAGITGSFGSGAPTLL
jgi:ABC-type hemin transport system ATPase subunit